MMRSAARVAVLAVAAVAAAVVALWLASRPDAPVETPHAPRVVIIGVDGADWEIVRKGMADGRLPNLQRIAQEGASGPLTSIPPFISPSVWTTIATGKTEAKHGVRGFLAERRAGALTSPTTSNMRRVKALWEIAGDRGLTSGFVGWLVTWPAERVSGYMISPLFERAAAGGAPTPGAAAAEAAPGDSLKDVAYPPSLVQSLREFVVRPEDVPDAVVARVLGTTRHLGDPRMAERIVDLRRSIASDLSTEVETFGPVIDRYYSFADSIVGEIAAAAGDAVVIVCSDHGFGGHGEGEEPKVGTAMHRETGILAMAGPGVKRGARVVDASVLDVTPTVLALLGLPVARDMDGRALVEALSDGALQARPVSFIASYDDGRPRGDAEPIASPVDDEIKEMLRSLGYIE